MPTGMFAGGLSLDLRDSKFFVRASEQKTPGQDPARRETGDRGGGEKHTTVANMLRRRSTTLAPIEWIPRPALAKPPSNASFGMARLLLAKFRAPVS